MHILTCDTTAEDIIDIDEHRFFLDIEMFDSDHLRHPKWTEEYTRLLKQIFKKIEQHYSQTL